LGISATLFSLVVQPCYNTDMHNFDLNNRRFSMFAAIGTIAAEIFSGKTAIAQLGCRAKESHARGILIPSVLVKLHSIMQLQMPPSFGPKCTESCH